MNSASIRAGCDIVNIARFQKILTRTPAMRKRLFLPREEKDASFKRLAGIFAAKEAVMKALNISAGRWHDIEVSHEKNGKPMVALRRKTGKKVLTRDLSIAHDGNYIIAFACFIEED